MKAIIIDDELPAITALQSDLHFYCKNVTVIDCCQSSKEGLLSIKKNNPDLVFLDIDMPWLNGLELLELLGDSINFGVIFTTAFSEYASKAFRLSAIDYLLKPIDKDELIGAVSKAVLSGSNKVKNNRINNLLYNYTQPAEKHRIALPNRDGYEFILVKNIVCCNAEGAYTNIVLANQRVIMLSKPLGEVAEMLPEELFERIHHSTIINVNFVKQLIRRDGTYVIMENGNELAISKSKKDSLMKRLGIS